MAADFTFSSIDPISLRDPEVVVRNLGAPVDIDAPVSLQMDVVSTNWPFRINVINMCGSGSGAGSTRPSSGFLYPRGQG